METSFSHPIWIKLSRILWNDYGQLDWRWFRPVRIRLAAPYRDAPTPLSVEESAASNSNNNNTDNDDDDRDFIIINDEEEDNSISSGNSSGTYFVPDEDELALSDDED